MKYGKLMLVTLVLLAILTLGAVSASDNIASDDELAVSEEAVDVQLPQEDFDEVLSENSAVLDDGDSAVVGDGEDDEGDSEFNLEFNDEMIITDENSDDYDASVWVAKLYSPQPVEGRLVLGNENATLFDIRTTYDENDWEFKYGEYRYTVTIDQVSLQDVHEGYIIHLEFYLGDDDEASVLRIVEVESLGNNKEHILLQDWLDPNVFRVEGYHDDMGVMELGDAVSVYCPDGYNGTVTVTVRNHGHETTFEKNISDKDDDYLLHWTLRDLNITEVGNYIFYVNACDGEFEWEKHTEVYNPLFFEHDLYIENYINRHAMITVEVPILYSNESRIIVEIDGVVKFNKTLSQFDYVSPYNDTDKSYYCTNEIVGYGENEYQRDRRLYIFTADIIKKNNGTIEAKPYNVNVYAIINGTMLNKSGKIRLHDRDIESEDGVSIEIFYINDFLIGCDDQNVASITAPEGANGFVEVTCNGDPVFQDCILTLEEDDGTYFIRPCDLDIHEYGEYEISITYTEDVDPIVENSAVLSFDKNFDGDNPFRFNKNEISTVGDEEYNENTFIVKLVLDEPTPGELRIFKDETLLLDLEIPDNNDDWGIVGWDGSSYYKIFLKDLTLDDVNDGDGLIIEFNYNEDESYSKDFDIEIGDDYFKFLVYEDEDGPLDQVDFILIEDEDGATFEAGDDVTVAHLLIPESENDDADVTITVTKNGQPFATIRSTEIEPEYLESREAYQYPINLDLTQVNDKDLLEFNIDCFDEGENVWPYAIEVDGDEVIFHGYYGKESCYVFYGNVTTEDLNSPDTMGPRPNGKFIEFSVPDSYNVAEGSIVVSDGNTVILNKSFDDIEEVEYNYEVLGNEYVITLNEFVLNSLPENATITFTINYGSDSLTFKRIRIADYVYKIVTPDDIAVLFDMEITDDEISSADDTVVSIVATDEANRQSIYMDVGGGWFKVFVNNIQVDGLGENVLNNWIYQSGILDVDEESADGDFNWQLESLNIDPNDFFNAGREEKASMLYSAAKDEFGSDIGLFHISSYNLGYPELYLSLEDLGITESGTYNIKITHLPEEPEEGDEGELNDYIVIREDAVILEKEVTFTKPSVTLSAEDLEMCYKDGSAWTATLTNPDGLPIVNAPVKIGIVNKVYTIKTNSNGVASLPINLGVGVYDVNATYESGDELKFVSAVVTVKNPAVILSANDLVMIRSDGSAWTVTLTDQNGNPLANAPIKVGIVGKTYTLKTNDSGVAVLPINLVVGVYEVNATFEDTARYTGAFITSTVTVNYPSAVSLSADDLIMCQNDGSAWTVTLKNASGKPIADSIVKIGINGKVYNIRTDANGVASLPINLRPGVYEVNATFKGTGGLGSAFINATITVKNPAAILAAEDIVMTYQDGSSYSVTLTGPNGNAIKNTVVKIKICGKTYERTTDDNGVATLPINLRAGTYDISAKFEGNSQYSGVEIANTIIVNRP